MFGTGDANCADKVVSNPREFIYEFWMGIYEHIKSEWPVIKGAPVAFLGLLIAGISGGFAGGMIFRAQEVANAESLVRLKDGQLDEYRKQIEERLQNVEQQLTDQQISKIKAAIESAPSKVEILTGDKVGWSGEVSGQLKNAFQLSGWNVLPSTVLNGEADTVVLRAPDARTSTIINEALAGAGVRYDTVLPPQQKGAVDFILKQKGVASRFMPLN